MTLVRKGLLWSAAIILLMIVGAIFTVMSIPAGETVPIHFDSAGNANDYGSRSDVAWILGLFIGITALTAGILAGAAYLVSRTAEEPIMHKTMLMIWIGTLLFMAIVMAWISRAFHSSDVSTFRYILMIIPLTGLWLGNIFPKTSPNTFIGIRTRKTLGDAEIWSLTHRAAGKALVAGGIIGALCVVVLPLPLALIGLNAGLIVPLIYGYIYSQRL